MRISYRFFIIGILFCFLSIPSSFAQSDTVNASNPWLKKQILALSDSTSLFARINKKAIKLFVYLPVPIYTYSQESGHTVGLAKFNLLDFYSDTVTRPSKISGVYTQSTKGRINFSLSTELVLKQNKMIFLSFVNYRKTPEYVLGIGNDVIIKDIEQISVNRIKFSFNGLYRVGKYTYLGPSFDIANYYNVRVDSNSILIRDNAVGVKGGTIVGLGVSAAYDTRDNRYNSKSGEYVLFYSNFYNKAYGSDYEFSKIYFDVRKFYQPWLNHVVALQVTTTYSAQDVPFYELAMLGGDTQMRGYYKGALRDKVLLDGQVEYRVPLSKFFGFAAWVGTGRVAPSYDKLSFSNLWVSYGGGLRLKVDPTHDTNLRLDFGFGESGLKAFYVGFAEAF